MRRAITWGLPLYAAIMTGVFIGKGLPDNNLRAEGDPARDNAKATVAGTPATSAPTPANGNAGSYPIPAPIAQPKHLLHVVIRYEGEGLPDQRMIAAALAGQAEDEKPKKGGKSKPDDSKAAQAKDTFQFIIRYEGDGIIDDNVAKVLKDYFAAEKAADAPAPGRYAPKGSSLPSLDAEPSDKPSPTPAAVPRNSGRIPGGGVPASPRNPVPREDREGSAPASRGPAPIPRGPAPATLPPADR